MSDTPDVRQAPRELAESYAGRADDCGRLARAVLAAADAVQPREPLTNIATDVIDGYKAGRAGQPMGIVSEAFDCGWISGDAERRASPPNAAAQSPVLVKRSRDESSSAGAVAAAPMPPLPEPTGHITSSGLQSMLKDDYAEQANKAYENACAQRAAIALELDAAKADAERYRALKAHDPDALCRIAWAMSRTACADEVANDPDAAIDAARREK